MHARDGMAVGLSSALLVKRVTPPETQKAFPPSSKTPDKYYSPVKNF